MKYVYMILLTTFLGFAAHANIDPVPVQAAPALSTVGSLNLETQVADTSARSYGYGSSADAYACHAWTECPGGAPLRCNGHGEGAVCRADHGRSVYCVDAYSRAYATCDSWGGYNDDED